ncbi:MAG: FAD-dependent thymidylate synthase [Halobacteria archaeon]
MTTANQETINQASQPLIPDPQFEVKRCRYGSSPYPELAVWDGQHHCVSEDPKNCKYPKDPGGGVIRNQLKVEHWSVLDQAFVKLNCYGFPHNVIAQITRHHDSFPLVQSMRYTSQRFQNLVAPREISLPFLPNYIGPIPHQELERYFYLRPVGWYSDREGNRFYYTPKDREADLEHLERSVKRYYRNLQKGMPKEQARSVLPYDFRQDFVIAGTIKAVFHMLDQRSKRDSQIEIRTLAYLAFQELVSWAPNFFAYYGEKRYGKARLAP